MGLFDYLFGKTTPAASNQETEAFDHIVKKAKNSLASPDETTEQRFEREMWIIREEFRRRSTRFSTTLMRLKTLFHSLDRDEILSIAVETIAKGIDSPKVQIYRCDGRRENLVPANYWARDPDKPPERSIPAKEGGVVTYLMNLPFEEACRIGVLSSQESGSGLQPLFSQGRIRTLFATPILVSENVFGVFNVESIAGDEYTREDIQLLAFVADAAGMALKNANALRDSIDTIKTAEATLEGKKRDEKSLRDSLARIVSPAVADVIVRDPVSAMAAPGLRAITILVLDFPEFFKASATWDRNGVSKFVAELIALAGEHISGFEGALDSFQQGRLIAIFGYPVESPLASVQGLLCATALYEALIERIRTDDRAGIRWPHPRMAVHSGQASVGPHGSERFLVFTALGGCASQALLLLEQAKSHDLLLSESVLGTHATIFEHELAGSIEDGGEKVFRIKGIKDLPAWKELAQSSRFVTNRPPSPAEVVPPERMPPPELIDCANCGTKNEAQAKFCQKCGMPVF